MLVGLELEQQAVHLGGVSPLELFAHQCEESSRKGLLILAHRGRQPVGGRPPKQGAVGRLDGKHLEGGLFAQFKAQHDLLVQSGHVAVEGIVISAYVFL